jgi:hypothetical protein
MFNANYLKKYMRVTINFHVFTCLKTATSLNKGILSKKVGFLGGVFCTFYWDLLRNALDQNR